MSEALNEQDYAREVKGFLFYSRFIWPLHRRIAKRLVTPRCRRCCLSANCSPLNKDGVCAECLQPENTPGRTAERTQSLTNEVRDAFRRLEGSGRRAYDALVMFSGGKDSAYLVARLRREHPGMRLLLFTVDTTLLSPYAIKNVQRLVQSFDLDHVFFRPPADLFNRMFRRAILSSSVKGCSGTVDQFDGDFFHDIGRNWAARNEIPALISGCSKTQVERILNMNHFESPREFEHGRRTEVAGIPLSEIFKPEEMHHWLNGERWGPDRVPRVFFPFYAWDLEENHVIEKTVEWGVLPPETTNPLLTNNQLIPLMAVLDMIQLGYSSFEPEFCQMVRLGKADKGFWQSVFELSEYSAKTGRLLSKSVDLMLNRLQLTRKQLGIPE